MLPSASRAMTSPLADAPHSVTETSPSFAVSLFSLRETAVETASPSTIAAAPPSVAAGALGVERIVEGVVVVEVVELVVEVFAVDTGAERTWLNGEIVVLVAPVACGIVATDAWP